MKMNSDVFNPGSNEVILMKLLDLLLLHLL